MFIIVGVVCMTLEYQSRKLAIMRFKYSVIFTPLFLNSVMTATVWVVNLIVRYILAPFWLVVSEWKVESGLKISLRAKPHPLYHTSILVGLATGWEVKRKISNWRGRRL